MTNYNRFTDEEKTAIRFIFNNTDSVKSLSFYPREDYETAKILSEDRSFICLFRKSYKELVMTYARVGGKTLHYKLTTEELKKLNSLDE